MKRIIWHWTAGNHTPSAYEKTRYHLLIDGDGSVQVGKHPISANASGRKLSPGTYAAHTANLNTDSIGLALCAMHEAKERPFNAGKYPITDNQITSLIDETAKLCIQYGIKPTRKTVLSHAEVEKSLGVKQKNKWDIMWVPGLSHPISSVEIGDSLRSQVAFRISEMQKAEPAPAQSPWVAIIKAILAMFGKGK